MHGEHHEGALSLLYFAVHAHVIVENVQVQLIAAVIVPLPETDVVLLVVCPAIVTETGMLAVIVAVLLTEPVQTNICGVGAGGGVGAAVSVANTDSLNTRISGQRIDPPEQLGFDAASHAIVPLVEFSIK